MKTLKINYLFLFLAFSLHAEPLKLEVNAPCAILINAESGAVLYEKNSLERGFPASTTKIATVIYTIERGNADLQAPVRVEAEALSMTSEQAKKKSDYKLPAYYLENDGTSMGLIKGEKVSLMDLMYGSMLASGNDASNVIAQHIGGTIPGFMTELNAYLIELGCQDTHFSNPHGLTHPNHYTTSADLARLAKHAMKNPLFKKIVGTVKHICQKTNKREGITLLQGNRLLRKGPYFYSKAIGVKTGYTAAAQHNIVAAAEHDGRTLILVLMHCKERTDLWSDSQKLFSAAFSQKLMERVFLPAGLQSYQRSIPGANRQLRTYLAEPLVWRFYPAEEEPIQAKLVWHLPKLPIKKGQQVGEIIISTTSGRVVAVAPLLAANRLKVSYAYQLWEGIQAYPVWSGLLAIGLLSTAIRKALAV